MKLILRFLLLLLFVSIANHSIAQKKPTIRKAKNTEDFKFMPLPYLNYNRSLGFTLGALPMAVYNLNKKDTISPSSVSGALGMYTTTQSYFVLQFNQFYLKEDKYRIKLAAGMGNINFQFFIDHPISPGYIDYNTEASFFMIEIQRKVYKKLYLGANYSYSQVATKFDIQNVPTQIDFFNGLGAVASLDVRDDVYYPHNGFIGNLNYITFPDFLDNKYISHKITLDYNFFFETKNKKNVIASRIYAGFGIGDLNFNQQFVIGKTDIRGYSLGKYRGDQVLAIQTEYRYNPYKKIGFVGFAGLATIFGSVNDSDNGKLLPGLGAGFRYLVFEKNHMNMGLDVAVGDGDWGLYFKIGESF